MALNLPVILTVGHSLGLPGNFKTLTPGTHPQRSNAMGQQSGLSSRMLKSSPARFQCVAEAARTIV